MDIENLRYLIILALYIGFQVWRKSQKKKKEQQEQQRRAVTAQPTNTRGQSTNTAAESEIKNLLENLLGQQAEEPREERPNDNMQDFRDAVAASRKKPTVAPEPKPEPTRQTRIKPKATPEAATEEHPMLDDLRQNIDLRKAVIYSEILKRPNF